MGLDIYFHKRKFNRHNPNEPIGVDEDGRSEYEKMPEVAYFRKVNFLMSFFDYYGKCEGQGNFEGNCCYVPIYDDEIDALIEACEKTLDKEREITKWLEKHRGDFGKIIVGEDEENPTDELPLRPQEGFFFGDCEIDEWYFESVKDVLSEFKRVKEELADDEEIFMYAWW